MIRTIVYGQSDSGGTVLMTETKMAAVPNIGDAITIDMGGHNFTSGFVLSIEHILDKHGAEHSMVIDLDTLVE